MSCASKCESVHLPLRSAVPSKSAAFQRRSASGQASRSRCRRGTPWPCQRVADLRLAIRVLAPEAGPHHAPVLVELSGHLLCQCNPRRGRRLGAF